MNSQSVKLSIKKIRKKIVLGVLVALFHFILSWISFMKSEIIDQSNISPVWNILTKILAFPFLYVSMTNAGIDWFGFFMVLNSLIWGLVAIVAWMIVVKI